MKITNLKQITGLMILLGLVGILVTSCERETIVEENIEDFNIIDNEQKLKQEYESYIEKYGEPVIEYMTLEELNAFNISKDLPIVTLEELGTTEEELAAAQAAIKKGLKPRNNCWFAYLADMDYDGDADKTDIHLAKRVILGIDPPNQQSYNFGFFSYYCVGENHLLTANDLNLVNQMRLGVSDCCN